MALFKKSIIKDSSGKVVQEERAGIFSKLTTKSDGNTTCVNKTDVFGISERNTCVMTPTQTTTINNKK